MIYFNVFVKGIIIIYFSEFVKEIFIIKINKKDNKKMIYKYIL